MPRVRSVGVKSPFRRVLVTGGAGVIGSHLVDALLESGVKVTVLDNLSTGRSQNLDAHQRSAGFRFVKGSILDAKLVGELTKDVDVVYHLAAVVGVKNVVEDPLSAINVNIQGTENVLSAASVYGVAVLLASTSEIYGNSPAAPFSEGSERILGPTWIHRWSYSTAKAIDEHLGFAHWERGLPVSIVRYFNAYGPRIDERGYGSVIARFAAQALAGDPITVHGDGGQSRCFTYVADTVRGTILAAETPGARGQVINIGSAEEVTIGDLALMVKKILGSSSPVVHAPYESFYGPGFEDTRRRVPDVRLAERLIGFRAEVTLRAGLEATLAWCKRNFGQRGSLGA